MQTFIVLFTFLGAHIFTVCKCYNIQTSKVKEKNANSSNKTQTV